MRVEKPQRFSFISKIRKLKSREGKRLAEELESRFAYGKYRRFNMTEENLILNWSPRQSVHMCVYCVV